MSFLLSQGNISRLALCLVRIEQKLRRFRKPNVNKLYIIGTLSQSSGGPIAFRLSNLFIYLFIYRYFLTSLRKI